MKFFRVVHQAEEAARLASPLWFLDRNSASRYLKPLLYPWEPLGYFRMPDTREEIPLGLLKLKVESVLLPASYDADLDWVCWRLHGEFGYSPVVPGRCFDPADWRKVPDAERRDPILAPKIAEAERNLDLILKTKSPETEVSGLDLS